MTERARRWLPEAAFAAEAVRAVLGPPVAAWSSDWFATGEAAVSRVRSGESRTATPQALRLQGRHVALELAGLGKRNLLEAALDLSLSEVLRGEGDNRVLDTLAAEIAEDLIERLDMFLGEGASQEKERQVCVTVFFKRNDLVELFLPDHVLVPLLKSRIDSAKVSITPLRSRREALKETKLVVSGSLGRAELNASELPNLSVGDVLVVDRALSEPVQLELAGRPFARGALRMHNGHASIHL